MMRFNLYRNIPINDMKQEIRVLELLPGTKGSRMNGRLVSHSLLSTDSEKYDALSYMWGAETPQDTIELNEDDSFEVKPNLHNALQTLRLSDKKRRIWIDAICINQEDFQERSRQVQLMRKVYQQAREVVIWLDEKVDPHYPAILKLCSINENSTKEDLGTDPSIFQPFKGIFQNPYWMRVWIQQEISNASSLRIQCRENTLPVYNVYHFLRLTHEQTDTISPYTPMWFEWADVRPNIRFPSRFGSISTLPLPLRGSTFHEEDQTLFQILEHSFKLKCTDERDRLFGLLFLSSDYSSDDIPVDYELGLRHAYAAFPKFVVKKYRSFDFLLYAGMNWQEPEKEREIPTWVPDWRGLVNEWRFLPSPG